MTGKIFISYRRDDSRADARSIFQHLQRTFDSHNLFMDVDSIEKGRDFRQVLDDHLTQCEVMLVVIGQRWLELGISRLHRPDDFVRLEIATALKRNVSVIPVLVDGAHMPQGDQLPDDLKPLLYRQAARISHDGFADDMRGIERDIRRILQASDIKRSRSGVGRWVTVALGSIAVLAIGSAAIWYGVQGRVPAPSAAKSEPVRVVVPSTPVVNPTNPAVATIDYAVDALSSITGVVLSSVQLQKVDASNRQTAINQCGQSCSSQDGCVAFDLSVVYGKCTLYKRVDSVSQLGGYVAGIRRPR